MPTNVPSKKRAALLRLTARMAEEAEKIGGRMAERRGELGLAQRQVAERMPGSYQGSDISRWERGRHRPESLAEIAEALETDVADLIQGPIAEREKEKPEGSPLDALAAASDLPTEVADALEALRLEMVGMRTQLLAEIAKVQPAPASPQPKSEQRGP